MNEFTTIRCLVLKLTDKAVLVTNMDDPSHPDEWIPLSIIENNVEVEEDGESDSPLEINIKNWFIEQIGWD